jgi:hypothetical protein
MSSERQNESDHDFSIEFPVDKICVVPKLDEILENLIMPADGDFSPELARYVLGMRFSEERAARYESLATKNQDGSLVPIDREELEAFVTANTLLMILKSKARRSLVAQPSAV